MTTTPPHDPQKSGSSGKKRNADEIAITDVPEDVVREMEELFGGAQTREFEREGRTADEQRLDPDPDGEATVIVLSDVRERGGSAASNDASESQTVIEINTDIDDVVVIGADEDEKIFITDDMDRIVIVDNDQPDPTFEERRRKRLRREKLKKVRWFKWAAIFVGVVLLLIAVMASPLFSVRDIDVEGVVYTSPEAVAAATDVLKGESFFTLDTDTASTILKADPWVADVRITKHFPDAVVIEISERVPIVWYVGEDNKARIVDANGVIIAVLDGWPTEYLQVTGVGPSLAGGAIADIGYRAAAQTVIALPEELARLVRSLELSPGGELSMTLTSGTIVRFGSPTDLQNKLVSVVVLLRRQDPSNISVIDVSTGEVTVAMR